MKTIYTEEITFNNEQRIKLIFSFDRDIINKIRRLPECRWNQNLLCWHIHYIENHLDYLNKMFDGVYNFRPYQSLPFATRGTPSETKPEKESERFPVPSVIDIEVYPEYNYFLVHFNKPYKSVWIEKMIKLVSPFWDADNRKWVVRNIQLNLPIFKNAYLNDECVFNIVERKAITKSSFSPEECALSIQKFTKQLYYLNYSSRTIRSYEHQITNFLDCFCSNDIPNLTVEQIKEYITKKTLEPNFSRSYQNQLISAIKLYFTYIHNRKYDLDMIERPHTTRKLPSVLSQDEIRKMLDSLRNTKHKLILSLIYSTGMRVSEATALTLKDIDYERNIISIKDGKGMKDRIVPLAERLILDLEEYIKSYQPKFYVFEGTNGKQYSPRSVQRIVKNALYKGKIRKHASVHTLRHSYATHLLENGTDLRYIQEILGHRSSKTTEIYTHVSTRNIQNVTSPFDLL